MSSEDSTSPHGPSSADRQTQLIETFVELADTLVSDFDVAALLHTLVVRCVEIYRVDEAAIMLLDDMGELHAVASSSESAAAMEILEVQKQQGPCVEALERGEHVRVPDLQSESERWPEYVAKGSELGIRTVDAIPLQLRDQTIGALDLFGLTSGSGAADDRHEIRALADVATIGLLQARAIKDARDALREATDVAGHLQGALDSRVAIEGAKGIVRQGLNIEMGEAFELLRRYARDRNLKIAAVATAIIDGSVRPEELTEQAG